MPKIEFKQFVRDCPANKGDVPSRNLIRDFEMLIDGEHRVTLRRVYHGRGYYIGDPDGRVIKLKDEWRNTGEVSSQAEFLENG